jgi:hypothetical protein
MHAKWDLLIMAVVAAGSWMWAENSHRIDLGVPDDEVVAAAPATCSDAQAGWNQPTIMTIDEGFQVASDGAVPTAPSGCPRE